jgi:hypothetical protein
MDKILNKISNLVLLLTIAASYLMWVVGIGTKATGFIYQNSVYLLAAAIAVVLLLRIKELKKTDWLLIGLAVGIMLFYTATSSMRHSNRFINASIPLIMLFLVCFKNTRFTKIDFGLLTGITGAALGVTLYRIYTELPKLVPKSEIWKSSNKLEAIWINTNTIGMTLLLSVIMLSILIKSFTIGYAKLLVLPVYAVGLAGIWVCQSKASLGALLLFILVDNLIPKKLLQNNYLLTLGFGAIFAAGPFIFHAFSKSATLNLFTGRERIWAEFFDKWFADSKNLLIGMAPFTASWKNLGTHNSYLYALGSYGMIGYILLFSVLLGLLSIGMIQKKRLSFFQISLFFGFLAICIQSTMEETLLANYWIPIIYSFIGLAVQKTEQRQNSGLD